MERTWSKEGHAASHHFSQRCAWLRKWRVCVLADCAEVTDSPSAQTENWINLNSLRKD